MIGAYLHGVDELRRQQGQLLEWMGFGPRLTPSRSLGRTSAMELLAYQAAKRDTPAVLVVPAPIKRHYIWDIAPQASAVARLIEAELQVYLIVWHSRGVVGGLDEYADRAIAAALDAIASETGEQRAFLAGHSLGGTFAAIFASLHPERVRGIVSLEGPIGFGAGALERLAPAAPLASALVQDTGYAAGTLLDLGSVLADPVTFVLEPLVDALQCGTSREKHALHLRVRRWTLDEAPMPRRLFEEVAQGLYRDNRFVAQQLQIAGRLADPRLIRAPVLAVKDPRSRVVPESSVLAYRSATSAQDIEFIDYAGEIGVVLQHVGVLVGESAHHELWPKIIAWLRSRKQ